MKSARANGWNGPSRSTSLRSPCSVGSDVPALVICRMPVLSVLYCPVSRRVGSPSTVGSV